jgi:hypothetical protein
MQRNPISIAAAVLAVAALAGVARAGDSPRSFVAARSAPAGVSCTATTMHPLSVRVVALDPVARGSAVRLLVRASSAVELGQVQVRMISSGGATNLGLASAALGALAPGRSGETTFTLMVPASGGRQYVQFQVSGRGPAGTLTRGACYNLMPDGPAEAGRLVVTPQGERVMEVRAGRIE